MSGQNSGFATLQGFAGKIAAVCLLGMTLQEVQAQEVPASPTLLTQAPAGLVGTDSPKAVIGAPVETVPGSPVIQESAPVADAGSADPFSWSKVPPVPVLPKAGYFFYFPTGPGYFSVLDLITDNYRDKPPAWPYPRITFCMYPFFDFSFAYLDDPNNTDHDFLDCLKRIHVGDNFLLTLGGEFRERDLHESNYLLKGVTNNWDLSRFRLFGDFWYQDRIRVYVEFIDAQSFNQNVAPLVTDRNFGDLLNAFVDVKLWDGDDRANYVRVGRQELLYGSQRLISPLDWANDLRTFQGVTVFSHGKQFDFDAFVVQPIVPNAVRFDSVDDRQTFFGAWSTYRPEKSQAIDLYYLNLSNGNYVATGNHGHLGGFDISTIGSRYSGDHCNLMWDFEGMYQFGEWSNQTDAAGAFTTAVGYKFPDLPMYPQAWVGYDYASGGNLKGGAAHNTFNQLFPFGHYYFGYLDIIGRQNIQDISGQFMFFPTKWLTCQLQYHALYLADAKDALYSSSGAIERIDPTGRAGTTVGQIFDFLFNIHLSNHQDVLFGYSHLNAGSFLEHTGNGHDIDFAYFQYSYRF